VDSVKLLREIIERLSKRKVLIILIGLIVAICSFLVTKSIKTKYTSRSTVFPLTNPGDNPLSSATLGGLLGATDIPKSFSSEASINIIELALSRSIMEDVAATQLPASVPEYGNKTVAAALIQQYNKDCSFLDKKIESPQDSIVTGSLLLTPTIVAKINKNGVLELNYTSTDINLVKPVSDILIASISDFYIRLRVQKATEDYNFTVKKIDSLQKVLNQIDARTIHSYNTTLFTPAEKADYSLPKDNLADEKMLVTQQRNININNREEALWRLQKNTPIIATLDKPNPPFNAERPSSITYAIVGFLLGSLLAVFLVIAGLLYKFAKAAIKETVFKQ